MKRVARAVENRRVGLMVAAAVALSGLCFGVEAPPTSKTQVGAGDWGQLGGGPQRNAAREAAKIPDTWNAETGANIKWRAKLGSVTWSSPVAANGKVYVGTNNAGGHLKRYPSKVDLGVLLCFRESNGEFLWQYSSEKLLLREHDRPMQGIWSSPIVEGKRLWLVNNRAEVVCLDAEGFRDRENDGPFTAEKPDKTDSAWDEEHEADIVWKFDMMAELGVRQHDIANCSPTIYQNMLFICTSNGVDASHAKVGNLDAPSFIALDKDSGKVLWTDNSPGDRIIHGQWSSPAVGVIGGVPQVIFAGGDGWLYGFRADRWSKGKPELLWKFDGKLQSANVPNGPLALRGFFGHPVIYNDRVYVALGEDPEHLEGAGCLWCVDATKRGDVSPTLIGNKGQGVIPNPNSGVAWRYENAGVVGNGPAPFEKTMHLANGSPAINDGLLFIADSSGLVHCLDAKTGWPHWTCDMLARCLASPLIVGDNVYVADEDGDVSILALSIDRNKSAKADEPGPLRETNMLSSIFGMPVVANDVLYVATNGELFAIATPQRKN